MKLEKYHGLGNSFLITNYQHGIDYPKLAKLVCNKDISIGSDGLIVVKNSPLEMLIFNRDGSEAIMCGNGLRCFIHYCFNNGLLINQNASIEVRTKSGVYLNNINSFEPFVTTTVFRRSLIRKEVIGLCDELYDSFYVRVGVKHNVIVVDENNKISIDKFKDNIVKQVGFCEETNVDLVKKIDDKTISVLTYERGVGFTSSCGTGSIASALVVNYLYSCSNDIDVLSDYGTLKVKIGGNKVYMTGPSSKIADIEVLL